MPEDTSPRIDKEKRRLVQQVVGSTSYYAKASDLITLVALSSVTSKQAKATEKTVTSMEWLLDYLATKPDATIQYYKSDIILNVHSDDDR